MDRCHTDRDTNIHAYRDTPGHTTAIPTSTPTATPTLAPTPTPAEMPSLEDSPSKFDCNSLQAVEPETDGDSLTQTAENDGNDGKAQLDIDGIEVDRKALVAFYHATGGETWRDNTNWLTDKPIGTWYGVDTDTTGRVDWLDLSGNQLSGEIPARVGQIRT